MKSCSIKLLTHPTFVSSVVYVFLGCVPILPTNSIPNLVLLGYSFTQSAFLCFDHILNKIFLSRQVKFMENVFPFVSPSTSLTSIVDTNSALPASLFTSGDYPAPLTSSPPPHPSSCRPISHPLIPPTSHELLNSSLSPHSSSC